VAGLPRVQHGAPLRVIVTPHGWLDRIPLWISDRWLDWLIYRFLWRGVRLPRS